MKWVVTLIATFLFLGAHAQIISSITCTKDSMELGEAFQIIYKLTLPQNVNLDYIDFSSYNEVESLMDQDTSLAPYYAEIELQALFANEKDKRVAGNLFKAIPNGAKKVITDTINAVIWDIGVFVLPHPQLISEDSIVADQIMELETPMVLVYPPPGIQNQDTTSAILPIKGIIKTERSWLEYWPYLAGLLLTALVVWGLFFFRNKKEKETEIVAVSAPPKPAHVIALSKLDKLEQEQIWKTGQVKEYQSELTYTLREYLENRYETPALEQTTDEIVKATQNLGLDLTQQKDISEILRIADMVKFAKAKPEEDINAQFLKRTRDFVLDTKLDEINIESDGAAE